MKNSSAISDAHGRIKRLLMALPKYDEGTAHIISLLADLVRKLPHYTHFELFTYDDELTQEVVEKILKRELADYFFYSDHMFDKEELVKHADKKCCIIKNPHGYNFSIWVQDPFIVIQEEEYGGRGVILLEPHDEICGSNDDEIPNTFEELALYEAKNIPLSFHGGNTLVADDFMLVGAFHFNESKKIIAEKLDINDDEKLERITKYHFTHHFGKALKIIPVGNDLNCKNKPQDAPSSEPFPHIDLYISLAGRAKNGKYQLLVGKPVAVLTKDEPLAESMRDCIVPIVENLEAQGFQIIRNPMPLTRTKVEKGNTYYCFYNNALIEIDGESKRIWMPTFGHGAWEKHLRKYDIENREIWHKLGFEVSELIDFHPFVQDKAGVRCVTKYMGRTSIYHSHCEQETQKTNSKSPKASMKFQISI